MGKVKFGPSSEKLSVPQVVEKIVYIDRPIVEEKTIIEEKITYIDRPIIEEKIVVQEKEVIVEKPVEKIVKIIETVEVPVVYEKTIYVDKPVIEERIIEVMPKVVDISKNLEIKRQLRNGKYYKFGLALSIILNVIIVLSLVGK